MIFRLRRRTGQGQHTCPGVVDSRDAILIHKNQFVTRCEAARNSNLSRCDTICGIHFIHIRNGHSAIDNNRRTILGVSHIAPSRRQLWRIIDCSDNNVAQFGVGREGRLPTIGRHINFVRKGPARLIPTPKLNLTRRRVNLIRQKPQKVSASQQQRAVPRHRTHRLPGSSSVSRKLPCASSRSDVRRSQRQPLKGVEHTTQKVGIRQAAIASQDTSHRISRIGNRNDVSDSRRNTKRILADRCQCRICRRDDDRCIVGRCHSHGRLNR